MRRTTLHIAVALITFSVGISIAGVLNPSSPKPLPNPVLLRAEIGPAPTSRSPEIADEQEIREFYHLYALAQTQHDTAFFKWAEADSFILTYSSGETLTRDQAIAAMKTWDKDVKYSNDILNVEFYKDVAVIKGRMTASYPQTGYSYQWTWLDVIMKRDGRWQILSTTQINY